MQMKSNKKSAAFFEEKVFIAGSGGQGVLFLGKLLYLTAVRNGYKAAYFPSYGAEVRGGTTKCMVTVSDRNIATPIFSKPDTAIILNPLSLKKYKQDIQSCRNIYLFQKTIKKILPLCKEQRMHVFSCKTVPSFENIRSAVFYSISSAWFSGKDLLQALEYILKHKNSSILSRNREVFEESLKEFEGKR